MEENREISYIVRMLLTTIGSYGIIRVLTSCALFQVSDMAVIFGILSAAVICVYGLYGRKKHFLTVTGIIFAGLSVLSFGILRAGFCHIYNDCMTALEHLTAIVLAILPRRGPYGFSRAVIQSL